MPDPQEDQVQSSATAEEEDAAHEAMFAEFASKANPSGPQTHVVIQGEDEGEPGGEEGGDPLEEGSDEDDKQGETPDPSQMTLEELRAANAKLEHQLKSERGRTSGLSRKISDLQSRVATTSKDVEGRKRVVSAAEERAKKINESASEYGEVIGPLAEEIAERHERDKAALRAQEKQLKSDQDELKVLQAEEKSRFETLEPEGMKILADNAKVFLDWIEDQPKRLRDAFARNDAAITDAEEAALLVGKFREHLAGSKQPSPSTLSRRRERQLEGARGEKPSRSPRTTSVPGDNASHEEMFDYFAKKLEGTR